MPWIPNYEAPTTKHISAPLIMSDIKGATLDSYGSDRVEDGLEMTNVSRLGGTDHDEQDMAALGKVQVLNVRIHLLEPNGNGPS